MICHFYGLYGLCDSLCLEEFVCWGVSVCCMAFVIQFVPGRVCVLRSFCVLYSLCDIVCVWKRLCFGEFLCAIWLV